MPSSASGGKPARPERRVVRRGEPYDGAGFSLFEHLHQPFLLWWSNPEQAFLQRLLRNDLEQAVDGLPEEFRTVVTLCDVQGFSDREIADVPETRSER
jgi:DNA-directed RNA polymerase specialized sigma24 family protein